ncbi:hypothetical protein JT05_07160 [Desulfosporosinus sp. Tol-M]|nr:hypothetical protein JT05_07160 [Desulfosporosinus sp. Tol-M]
MLELQHRLIRRTINIAVSKAMEDMKSNTNRSIRNLIDLGLLFSTSENQKWFFNAAKKVIANPNNPYNSLLKRMISDVNNDTIKKVGLNLGYSSLVYGANKLKKKQDYLGVPIPWLLIFDIYKSNADFFHQMEHFIGEGRELGIHSYIACPHEKNDIPTICEIAKRFDECLFILKVSPGLISEQTAKSLGKIHNMMISVQIMGTDFSCGSDKTAFRLLKQNHCLYGFHVNYNEDTMKQLTTLEYIRSAIGLGNLFCVYIAENGVSDTCRDAVYTFACNIRGENGQPLITLEWFRDMRVISEKILSGDGYLRLTWRKGSIVNISRQKMSLQNRFLEYFRAHGPVQASDHVL